jgi:hypothetical protein
MKKSAWLVAASALLAGSAMAGSVVYPEGSLGSLTPFPALYGNLLATNKVTGGVYTDDYFFDLSQASTVTGSVGSFFGTVTFSKVLIDGTPLTLTATNSGYGFSLANVAAGTGHKLTVQGAFAQFGNGYVGGLTATPAVPEPESIALALAGLGVVGSLARRRRQQ